MSFDFESMGREIIEERIPKDCPRDHSLMSWVKSIPKRLSGFITTTEFVPYATKDSKRPKGFSNLGRWNTHENSFFHHFSLALGLLQFFVSF